jgi:hypothetical protein
VTGTDWLVVALMVGAVAAAIVFDRIITRRHDVDAENHKRLMAELRRQP